jgi:RimJ/RimL family protein N-acetyltransferase
MITLRPIEQSDLDALYEQQADPAWADMAAFPARDRAAFVAHQERVAANPHAIRRTVLVDGVVSGSVVSWLDEDGRRLVGYGYGREFWGRGIASEALRQFLDEMIDRPLYAHVALSNAGSMRVLEKCGFVAADEPQVGDDGVAERLFILR